MTDNKPELIGEDISFTIPYTQHKDRQSDVRPLRKLNGVDSSKLQPKYSLEHTGPARIPPTTPIYKAQGLKLSSNIPQAKELNKTAQEMGKTETYQTGKLRAAIRNRNQ